jgi:hypothetical protein
MTTCTRKTTWPAVSIALAVMMSLSPVAVAMGVGGAGGSAAGHVGGSVGGVGSHGGRGPGVVGGGAGHAGAQRSGWGAPHREFNRGGHGDTEGRRRVPWSPYLWLGNPYPRCQIDQYGRQHCY